jgi:hypothetical protein
MGIDSTQKEVRFIGAQQFFGTFNVLIEQRDRLHQQFGAGFPLAAGPASSKRRGYGEDIVSHEIPSLPPHEKAYEIEQSSSSPLSINASMTLS